MNKLYTLCMLLMLNAAQLMAQHDFAPYESKFQITPSFGARIPLQKFFRGEDTDKLIGYNDNSGYWQIFSGNFFFDKHWGIAFDGQLTFTRGADYQGFVAELTQRLSPEYFVTNSSHAYSETSAVVPHITTGFVYRYEKGRWYVYPKLSIGFTTFDFQNASLQLKEKNSNRNKALTYTAGSDENGTPSRFRGITSLTVSTGYKINKRISLNLDVMASRFKPNITYTRTLYDQFDGTREIDHIYYNESVISLSIGAGAIITLR